MILNKSQMKYAAWLLGILCLCIVKWGTCISDPPNNPGGNITDSENEEAKLGLTTWFEEIQHDIEVKGLLQDCEEYCAPSISPKPLFWLTENEDSNQNNTSLEERKENRREYILGKRRLPRVLNENKDDSLKPNYETFDDLQNADGFIDKTNFTM
jgi:hypothetical protein